MLGLSKRTISSLTATALALGLLAACSSSGGSGPSTSNNDLTEKQVTGTSLPPMVVAFTFDDGPGQRTSELSSYLKSEGIQAAFFMMGGPATGKDSLMDQVNADGHIIGNHTFTHPLLTSISSDQVFSEISKTDAVVSPHFIGNMKMFRAPYGGWSPSIADKLNQTALSGYVGSIFWDIGGDLTATHAADWACWGQANLSVEECGDRYIQEIHDRGNHGIILSHDIHSKTIDMIKYIVPKLKAQGFSFARVDQVPAINAQLIAKGATPLPAIGTLPTTSASGTTSCTANGQSGQCIDTSTCSSQGGTSVAGLCPGAANIECCVGGTAKPSSLVASSGVRLADDPLVGTSCPTDGIYCGGTISGDASTLYRCTSGVIATVCACSDTCGIGVDGVDGSCTCATDASEPGSTDDDLIPLTSDDSGQ